MTELVSFERFVFSKKGPVDFVGGLIENIAESALLRPSAVMSKRAACLRVARAEGRFVHHPEVGTG